MDTQGIHHVAIVVSDLERSLAFYEDVFGVVPEERHDMPASGLSLAFLRVGGTLIELLCYSGRDNVAAPGTTDHVAFAIDDVDAVAAALTERGIAGPGAAPRSGPGGSRVYFFSGPDGEKLELFQRAR